MSLRLFFPYFKALYPNSAFYSLVNCNRVNKLCLHQFLGTKITETNKLLKTDANEAYFKITNEQKERA